MNSSIFICIVDSSLNHLTHPIYIPFSPSSTFLDIFNLHLSIYNIPFYTILCPDFSNTSYSQNDIINNTIHTYSNKVYFVNNTITNTNENNLINID